MPPKIMAACLNSTITAIFSEMEGRRNFGEGVLWIAIYEAVKLPMLNPGVLDTNLQSLLTERFERMSRRPVKPIFDEIHQPDRRALDDVVFDVLGLTAGEREAVYEAVIELVRARLEKAKSV
jgi:hypothetical protein